MKFIEFKKTEQFSLGWNWPQKTKEIWQINGKAFEISVIKGKPLEVTKLKDFHSKKFKEKVKIFRKERLNFFKNSANLEKVKSCYFCQSPVEKNPTLIRIYGAQYVQCPKCSLVFLKERFKANILNSFYQRDKTYSSTYTDKKTLKVRLNQVVLPKTKWMEKVYQESYGKKPKTILDVGAGGGHFVFSCQKKGYKAEGIEISKNSCHFAKENFGIDLKRKDFLKFLTKQKYNVITFWGVIEHLINPRDFLQKAKELLTNEGMIVIQGPNFYSLSTALQKFFNRSIVRHLDPLSHLMIFTEPALGFLLSDFNFKPRAVWYLGMDIYELFCQLSNLEYEVLPKLNSSIQELQKILDLKEVSDSIILAAIN